MHYKYYNLQFWEHLQCASEIDSFLGLSPASLALNFLHTMHRELHSGVR